MWGAARTWVDWYFAPQPQLSSREQRWYAINIRLLPLAAVVHLVVVVLFATVGVPILAWFNVGSVILYVVAALARRCGREHLAFWLAGLELIGHSTACVHQIGWDAGVQFTLLLVAILGGVKITRAERIALSTAAAVTFLLLRQVGPAAVVLERWPIFALLILSVTTTFVFCTFVVLSFDGIATRLEDELRTERVRREELLKRELSHQVAERSRELARALARTDDTRPAQPKVGECFASRYRIERELGAGAMGVVYEVERVTDGERLAIKVVTGAVSPDRAARFAREAEIGARIRHVNLVAIVDVGVAGGLPFLAMELARKGSLEDQRARFGDVRWAQPILLAIARGLETLHAAGVLHRDLKPANVLLFGDDDGDSTSKISDFGLSRYDGCDSADDQTALTQTGMLFGTPSYMAPEAITKGKVDASADVFAFGVLAMELLTARTPWTTPPIFQARARLPLESPAGLDELDEDLRALLASCLAEDPSRRPSIDVVTNTLAKL